MSRRARSPRRLRRALVAASVLGALALASGCRTLPPTPAPEPGTADRRPADLRPFLESYFSSWSAGDMAAYRAHFDATAAVFLVREGGVVARLPLESFFGQQARAQADPATRAVERMETWEAHADGQTASATVRWVLGNPDGTRVRGVDRFLLVRSPEGAWKIVSLVFYATGPALPPDPRQP